MDGVELAGEGARFCGCDGITIETYLGTVSKLSNNHTRVFIVLQKDKWRNAKFLS